MKKLRVGVLMGGKSIEREVSFNSGRTVCDHLDTHLYEVKPLFQDHNGDLYFLPWKFLYRGKITDFQHRLNEAEKVSWDDLKNSIDFMYIAAHGRYAEDGTLQGMLEILKIPYLGSKVYASAICMNKNVQKEILKTHGIDVPRGIALSPSQLKNITHQNVLDRLEKENIHLPVIIRPEAEGSSLGIKAVFNEKELIKAINDAATIHPEKKQTVLVEEKLEGMEFCSVIITDQKTNKLIPLPLTEVVLEDGSHIFDYQQKYMPGRSIQYTPARCSKKDTDKIIEVCMKTMRALEITNLIRTDGFLTSDGRIVILDPNTLTGMGPATFIWRQAAHKNMSHTDLINHLIKTEISSYNLMPVASHDTFKGAKMEISKKKLRVAVLLGGRSHEKEISLESGRNVFYKLSPLKYEAIPIFVDSKLNLHHINQKLLVCHSTQEIEDGLDPAMHIQWSKLPELVDFVFIALHGGEGENGSIQGALEMLSLPYNGSGVLSSALCIDKYKTNNFLKQKSFNIPKNLLISQNDYQKNPATIIDKVKTTLNFPLIVKPHDDGCSVLVQKINDVQEIKHALEQLFKSNKAHALIEEFITGMELTVGVIGNENPLALPPSQAISHKDILSIEEKFLPGSGENQTPAPLSKSALGFVQKTIKDVYISLGCKGYSRIDCFYQNEKESPTGNERVIIIEVNTLPGMTPATCLFHQAAEIGIKPMEFIDKTIELGLEEHKILDQQKNQEKTELAY